MVAWTRCLVDFRGDTILLLGRVLLYSTLYMDTCVVSCFRAILCDPAV